MFLADSTIPDTSITVGVSVGLIEDTTIIGSSRPVNGTGGETEQMMPLKKNNLTSKNNIKEKSHSYANERLIALEKKLIGTKPKSKTNTKGNGNSPPSPSNPNEGYCFTGLFQTTTNTNAEVVVEANCDTTRPLLDDDLKNSVIIEILRNMFSVKKENDNDITCTTDLDDQGGWAASILPPFTGDYYKSHNSYYYIDIMMFSLSWGYCINEINKVFSTPTIIDDENGILSGIQNIGQREDVLKDLNAILEGVSEGRKLIYYPLPKTREHELKHISQYKDSLKQYYDVTLNAINWIETPPVDWCKILSISKYLDMRKEKFDQFLKQATENYLESNKNFKEKYEDEAVEAGLDYVRNTLIPEVIRFPK